MMTIFTAIEDELDAITDQYGWGWSLDLSVHPDSGWEAELRIALPGLDGHPARSYLISAYGQDPEEVTQACVRDMKEWLLNNVMGHLP